MKIEMPPFRLIYRPGPGGLLGEVAKAVIDGSYGGFWFEGLLVVRRPEDMTAYDLVTRYWAEREKALAGGLKDV